MTSAVSTQYPPSRHPPSYPPSQELIKSVAPVITPTSGVMRKYFYSNNIKELQKYIDYIDPELSLSDYEWGLKEGYCEIIGLLVIHKRFFPDPEFVINNMEVISPQLLTTILNVVKFSQYILNHLMEMFCENLMFDLIAVLHKKYSIEFPEGLGLIIAQKKSHEYIYNLHRVGYAPPDYELEEIRLNELIDEYSIFVNFKYMLEYYKLSPMEDRLCVIDDMVAKYPDASFNTNIVFLKPIKDMIQLIIKSQCFNILSSICKKDLTAELRHLIITSTWGSTRDTIFQYLLLLINNTAKFNQEYLINGWGRFISPVDVINWHSYTDSIKCCNIEDTKSATNDETFSGKDFKQCLSETGILINLDNYILDINELFAYWTARINSYDHIIVPHYPDHPYTRKPISGKMLFSIFYIAISKKINIPSILRVFIFRPKLLKIMETLDTDEDYRIELLRTHLFALKFGYGGGDPSVNDAGEWSCGSLVRPERELYQNPLNSSLILTMCYLRYVGQKN